MVMLDVLRTHLPNFHVLTVHLSSNDHTEMGSLISKLLDFKNTIRRKYAIVCFYIRGSRVASCDVTRMVCILRVGIRGGRFSY